MTSYPFAKNFTHPRRAPLTDLHRAAKTLDAATSIDGKTPGRGINATGFNRNHLILQNALLSAQNARKGMM